MSGCILLASSKSFSKSCSASASAQSSCAVCCGAFFSRSIQSSQVELLGQNKPLRKGSRCERLRRNLREPTLRTGACELSKLTVSRMQAGSASPFIPRQRPAAASFRFSEHNGARSPIHLRLTWRVIPNPWRSSVEASNLSCASVNERPIFNWSRSRQCSRAARRSSGKTQIISLTSAFIRL
jgi:hypothetical protein